VRGHEDEGNACSFLQWFDSLNTAELMQSLREPWHNEIHDNKKRRETE
jgi:hypothetical protein